MAGAAPPRPPAPRDNTCGDEWDREEQPDNSSHGLFNAYCGTAEPLHLRAILAHAAQGQGWRQLFLRDAEVFTICPASTLWPKAAEGQWERGQQLGLEARLQLRSLLAGASALQRCQSQQQPCSTRNNQRLSHIRKRQLYCLLENTYDTVIRFILLKNLQ